MKPLTVKSAREIVSQQILHQSYVVERAKGFLECAEQAEKMADVLRQLSDKTMMDRGERKMIDDSLADWRKTQG